MSGSAVVAASMNPFIKELEEEARLLARLKNKIVTQIATLQVCQPLLLLIPMWLSHSLLSLWVQCRFVF